LFTNVAALITKGEKVAVVGRNGVGKTTFVRSLIGQLTPDTGKATWGHEAQIGYMPQDVKPIIPTNTTCFDYLHDIDPSAGNEEIRGLLGRMLFRGDAGMKPTKALSGGEAVRLLFCKLMLVKPNVLVLDALAGPVRVRRLLDRRPAAAVRIRAEQTLVAAAAAVAPGPVCDLGIHVELDRLEDEVAPRVAGVELVQIPAGFRARPRVTV